LEEAKIIAKHIRKSWYFINPNFIFNGTHVIFINELEYKEDDDIKLNNFTFSNLIYRVVFCKRNFAEKVIFLTFFCL
ncbi:hypothetical protein M4Z11_07060, partial [Bartonella sp. G70]|nr:hypothetical protein [Bartonella sp. G70]